MKKELLVISLVLVVVSMLTVATTGVYAKKPMDVEGTWIIVFGPSSQNVVGNGDVLIKESPEDSIEIAGDIVGTDGTFDRRLVFHDYLSGLPNSWITQHGIITIDATFDDMEGTLYIRTSANSKVSPDGEWRIIGGTGELANLHGQGTFDHVNPFIFNYEGQVQFDP